MLLVNANVVDGRGGTAATNVAVELRDGRILSVGPNRQPGADAIDLEGRYVLPGLINAHDHLSLKGLLLERGTRSRYYDIYRTPAEVQVLHSVRGALISLSRGITSVRDAGSAWFASLYARDAIRKGVLPGPRVFTCGRVLSVPFEGEGVKEAGMTTDAEGPEQIRARVQELVGMGVDFIKLKGHRRDFSSLDTTRLYSREDIHAAASAAHSAGRKFALHVWHNQNVVDGIDVIDSVEHGNLLYERPDLIEQMAARGVIYVPNVLNWAPSPQPDPNYKSISGIFLEGIWPSVETAIKKGVTLAAGTDLHNDHLHSELEVYRKLGLDADGAIAAVTINGAKLLGLDKQLGTVEPGKLADLTIVEGDPRDDLSLLAEPWAVVSHGRFLNGAQLREMVREIPEDAVAP